MGGGLFYSNPIRGLAIKYIPLRCGYLFDVVCAVGEIVLTPHTVYGRKIRDPLIIAAFVFLPELERTASYLFFPFAELFERHGAFLRVQLVLYFYRSSALISDSAFNTCYRKDIAVFVYFDLFIRPRNIGTALLNDFTERTNIIALIKLIRTDIESSRTVFRYRCSINNITFRLNELEGSFFFLAVALPGLIYGQFRVAADVNHVAFAYFILCCAAGLKHVHIDVNGEVDSIKSLCYCPVIYFGYGYDIICYCKCKIFSRVPAIFDRFIPKAKTILQHVRNDYPILGNSILAVCADPYSESDSSGFFIYI